MTVTTTKYSFTAPDGTSIHVDGPQRDRTVALIKAAPSMLAMLERLLKAGGEEWGDELSDALVEAEGLVAEIVAATDKAQSS